MASPGSSLPARSARSRCGIAVRTAARCAREDNPVVARVNGVDIHESDLAFAEEEIGSNMPQMPPDQKRDYLITYLTDVIIVSQAAEQQKLADQPETSSASSPSSATGC